MSFKLQLGSVALIYASLLSPIATHPYDQSLEKYNINVNQSAGNQVLSYNADWPEKRLNGYHPSPVNWRTLPFYTVILDRLVDGDPSNNDFFGTRSEWEQSATQLRHGGDITGLAQDRVLDYIYGMGYRTVYIAGTPWVNMPWQSDSYSALDFTLLDPHFGTLEEWRATIDKIHAKGMYVMLDMTVNTLGDRIGFKNYVNVTAPFSLQGYEVEYKDAARTPWGLRTYTDFNFTNTRSTDCKLPDFYSLNGSKVESFNETITGCYNGDFDQYGDLQVITTFEPFQRQLAKYGTVQDRLREWDDVVAQKLEKLTCLTIQALDPDCFRIDKASQLTVNFSGRWGKALKTCARSLGKNNFFAPGEITDGDKFAALYIGRGRQPQHYANLTIQDALQMTANQSQYFMRDTELHAFDSSFFQYSVYRTLTILLDLDHEVNPKNDVPIDLVTAWNSLFVSNDYLNSETGLVDPRHLYGTSNQDLFRWSAIKDGTEKMLLGQLITNLVVPGIPLLYYGEEQEMYLFDSTANNYHYGRQPMTSTRSWQTHGCYRAGSILYKDMPIEKALNGCHDEWNSLDHFDPTAAPRHMLKHFTYLRSQYAVLRDGFNLTQYGNWTDTNPFPKSPKTNRESGVWSVSRGFMINQPVVGQNANVTVWILYSNLNETRKLENDCTSALGMFSPYSDSVKIRNLVFPYETYDLEASQNIWSADGQGRYRACLPSITLNPFGFKVFVPASDWTPPIPHLVGFTPGHDARILSKPHETNSTIPIKFMFSEQMSCSSVSSAVSLTYTIDPSSASTPQIDSNATSCTSISPNSSSFKGVPPAMWIWSSSIIHAVDGMYQITINNATSNAGISTDSIDHVIIRKGLADNPITFQNVTYSRGILQRKSNGIFKIVSNAAGADSMRYSVDFGETYSSWRNYTSELELPSDTFSTVQFWSGNHIRVQYHSKMAGSAAQAVDSDYGIGQEIVRRVPQLLLKGPYNQWGLDSGIPNNFVLKGKNWTFDVITTWPNHFQLTTFTTHDDVVYGDVDGDGALDVLPPNTQALNYLNLSHPASPFLGWRITVDQLNMTWSAYPIGNESVGIMLFFLFAIIPLSTAIFACWVFRKAFYSIKFNQYGFQEKGSFAVLSKLPFIQSSRVYLKQQNEKGELSKSVQPESQMESRWPHNPAVRRKILIATLEYDIPDWKLQVKIGGLGVMASLMGRVMDDVELVWVVPKVKDLVYPEATPEPPILITIHGNQYRIGCQTHRLRNITYYLLESPIFRANTKSDPYPARMDDLSSAIFYSAWNQSIAEICRRTPDLDIYHINDYHGSLAPLYLLPVVLPVCLSLHNAEFQGLWPLRTIAEGNEVSKAFNLPRPICTKYVQFGNIFNLLHAGARFISHHQNSTGVAGVSDKYGKRSWARYPALWTLKTIDSLPNPDPSDIAELDTKPTDMKEVIVNRDAEEKRPEDKRKTQEWAGLHEDPNAQLFVFVGRWSIQKGVDLVADVFTKLLEEEPDVQLITVGPLVDLYGRFAAAKLNRLMEMYPGRVFSKPEFTALPPYVFSGGDFALIPSRDEPFGLVAVEFGRGGALGVGSRLGGLGRMPGWWFPVESDSTAHMHAQFLKTIKEALKSSPEERAILRARSALQRFPVLEWRHRIENLHRRAIIASRKYAGSLAAGPNTTYADPKNLALELDDTCIKSNSREDYLKSSALSSPSMSTTYLDSTSRLGEKVSRVFLRNPRSPPGSGSINSASIVCPTPSPGEKPLREVGIGLVEDEIIAPAQPPNVIAKGELLEATNEILEKYGATSPINQGALNFTDEDGKVASQFISKLKRLDSINSMDELCVSNYIVSAEKLYFKQVKQSELTVARSLYGESTGRFGISKNSAANTISKFSLFSSQSEMNIGAEIDKESYQSPPVTQSKLNQWQIRLQATYWGWPLYSILLTAGQILGATSFQLSLLGGTSTQKDNDLYIIGAMNILGSIAWYVLKSMKPATWSLSIPWIFFGLAFMLIGLPSLTESMKEYPIRHSLSLLASSLYSFASASGFLFFSANFGEEAGGDTDVWIYRACVVQGTQQLWVVALWYWGFKLQNTNPFDTSSVPSAWINVVTLTFAVLCFFAGYVLFYGLPHYYHQLPGTVPNFVKTLFRRKLVLWYLAAEVLRDYWLSGPYGRNWSFLWSGQSLPAWATAILTFFFFVIVWGLTMWVLGKASKQHTWLLPIFSVGLGAPRWCQMLWGTSSVALYTPWAGGAGPYLSTSLWLWLGVLDAVQGVGLGIILLQTLSRVHVAATLCIAQIIGSTAVLVAKASAPNRIGPGHVFPDLGLWDPAQPLRNSPVARWEFWIALACQLIIVAGYLVLFRREQLSKP